MALAWLRQLKIKEVSSVDNGAGLGVQVLLTKRADGTLATDPVEKADLAKKNASEAMDGILDAVYGLQKSINSIVADPNVPDLCKSLEESFGQFREFIIGKEQGMSDIDAKKYADALAKAEKAEKEAEESKKETEKAKADCAKLQKSLRKVSTDLAITKMSDKHQSYMDDSDMDEDERDDFADKSPAERDAHMEKNPLEKRMSPVALRKRNENIEMSKRLDELTKRDDVTTFAKRAVAIGMPESFGSAILKARKGKDEKEKEEGVDELEKAIHALTAQKDTAILFKEFGKSTGGDAGSAVAIVEARASELMKSDTKLDKTRAMAKVFESDVPLAKRYRAETESKAA